MLGCLVDGVPLDGHAEMIEDIYPLSSMQHGILFHTLDEHAAGLYVAQFCATFESTLSEVSIFRKAWEQVVERHPVLRTSFVWENVAESLQLVEYAVKLPWTEIDWLGLSEEQKVIALERHLEEDRARSFDIRKAPLMRVCIIRTDERHFDLIWSHHHLLLDGWSVLLVLSEVLSLYEGFRTENPVRLPYPRPYSDYIAWLQRHDLKPCEVFWRDRLKDCPRSSWPSNEYSSETSTASQRSFVRRVLRVPLDESARLERVLREHHLALNTVVQATWGMLLGHYSGERDVIFGATTAGRPVDLCGVANIVGVFINTLPVRLRLYDSESFLECSKRLQLEQSEAR